MVSVHWTLDGSMCLFPDRYESGEVVVVVAAAAVVVVVAVISLVRQANWQKLRRRRAHT